MKRRFLAALLCICMLCGLLPQTAAAAGDDTIENYALNAMVLAASGSSPEGEGPEKALDGNTGDTKWCLTQDTGWFVFKISTAAQPDTMTVHHAKGSNNDHDKQWAGTTTTYSLQVLKNEQEYVENPSEAYLQDDENWQTVAAENNNTNPKSTKTQINMIEGRQIYRFKVDDAGSDNCIRVYEIQLANQPINLAKNANVLGVSNTSPNNNETAAMAFDENTDETKWCTGMKNDGGEWLVFDIHKEATVQQLKVYHAGAGKKETVKNNTTDYA